MQCAANILYTKLMELMIITVDAQTRMAEVYVQLKAVCTLFC